MREYYGYDNSQFVNSLEEKGFFIAHGSRNKNATTERSIATTLNMEYVSDTLPRENAIQKIVNNKVLDFLKKNGYKYVCLLSRDWGWEIDDDMDLYSDFFNSISSIKSSFSFRSLVPFEAEALLVFFFFLLFNFYFRFFYIFFNYFFLFSLFKFISWWFISSP